MIWTVSFELALAHLLELVTVLFYRLSTDWRIGNQRGLHAIIRDLLDKIHEMCHI
jgi:hypothetical protein